MKKYKKYIIYSVITLVFSFLGAALVFSVAKKNFGSTADWFSVFGSIGAILFAYWQILEQKAEYKNDKNDSKKKEKLSNRACFTMVNAIYVEQKGEIVYDRSVIPPTNFFSYDSQQKIYKVNKDCDLYRIKNSSDANAINCIFKVEYSDGTNDILNFEDLRPGSEKTIIPAKIIKSKNATTVPQTVNNIEIYFTSIRNEHYVQRWNEKIDYQGRKVINMFKSQITDLTEEYYMGNYDSITATLL